MCAELMLGFLPTGAVRSLLRFYFTVKLFVSISRHLTTCICQGSGVPKQQLGFVSHNYLGYTIPAEELFQFVKGLLHGL